MAVNNDTKVSSKDKIKEEFFIADLLDIVSLQVDIPSLEYPFFAIKAGDTHPRYYENDSINITITPHQTLGLATIHDKDIWIYCISKLMQAMHEEREISRTVRFTIYDYLTTTNRTTSGRDYERTKDALDRLRSTGIRTNIETAKYREARGFGLIDSWRIVEEKDGRMVRVEVTLPDWLFRSVISKQVLTISPDYFKLRKPLDRRIYEIARKHCGNQSQWKISLELLLQKTGASTILKEFRRSIRSLVEANNLPDYEVQLDIEKDMVIFTRIKEKKERNIKKEIKAPETKTKRIKISKNDAEKMAKEGEQWSDLLKRISKKYIVVFDEPEKILNDAAVVVADISRENAFQNISEILKSSAIKTVERGLPKDERKKLEEVEAELMKRKN